MSGSVDTMEFTNLGAREMFADPYPRHAQLRKSSPVSMVKAPLIIRGTGYLLTRYEDVLALHSDPRFSTDAIKHGGAGKVEWLMPSTLRLLTETMVFKDDPDHKRLRNLVHKAFTPKLVATMAGDIADIAADLVEQLAERRDVDLVNDFAVRLPLTVIATMLGVSDRDRDKFHEWCHRLSQASGTGMVGLIRTTGTARKLIKLFQHLADERRLNPDQRLISELVRANEDGDKLSEREVVAMIFLLLLAGHDTTANLIGSSVLALLDHPDQLAKLRANPELIDTGIEELLRYTSPVPCGGTRFATEEVEIAGTRIPTGSQIIGMISSANRDETVFDNADDLDLSRKPNRHIAFAFGPHYCLGHQLARLEGRSALMALLQRFDNLEVTVPRSELRYKPVISLRGLVSLPMRVG